MAVNFSQAVSAYRRIAQEDQLPGFAKAKEQAGGGFADALRDAAGGAVESLREGERQSLAAAVGKADLTDVVTAVGKAEMTLQTVVTLRDRVIQAYQEIIRMPI